MSERAAGVETPRAHLDAAAAALTALLTGVEGVTHDVRTVGRAAGGLRLTRLAGRLAHRAEELDVTRGYSAAASRRVTTAAQHAAAARTSPTLAELTTALAVLVAELPVVLGQLSATRAGLAAGTTDIKAALSASTPTVLLGQITHAVRDARTVTTHTSAARTAAQALLRTIHAPAHAPPADIPPGLAAGTATASSIAAWATSQGWTRIDTPGAPTVWTDQTGTARVALKHGSPRTPGSDSPHVSLRDHTGRRIDPTGRPTPRRSDGNHTPIRWDLT